MRLGVHVPIAGGLPSALAWARQVGCTTMQIFSRSPRGGQAPRLNQAVVERFSAQRRQAGIAPLVVHSPYIINLASPEPQVWRVSVALLQEECARAAQLGAQYLVTHVGSHRGHGEAAGIRQVAQALDQALETAPSGVMVLLENTAGSGQGVGSRFEALAAIREAARSQVRVGICLDTAHLFAAGFPIHTPSGLAETVAHFHRVVGLDHLKLLHLNDSKVVLGSCVDRHWHIGQGHIGLEGMRGIVNHPAFQQVPWILETPKERMEEDRRNLDAVRQLVRPESVPRTRASRTRRSATRTAAHASG